MNATDLIAQIKIASPCSARWEEMSGGERARFCAQCQKHVYNFSAMTPEAIAELVKAKEGRLCARFYRRADGTMLTADCPVGFRRVSRRLKVLVLAAGGLLLASLYLRALGNAPDAPREKGPFALKCEDALFRVQCWLGLKREVAVAGMICVPAPKPPPGITDPGSGPDVKAKQNGDNGASVIPAGRNQ